VKLNLWSILRQLITYTIYLATNHKPLKTKSYRKE